ncbi:SIMPL domain-containing protein [Sphingomonas yunnanensis]|uniref:SIMPL domain-containing protein n=1 Tax=Sphingomonas yunnanensis TaxID=310400 RepID=UPI001CA6D317|nr:SIMPL domain-containing protein [Sphingomonas yunnanensis]MBY9063344.1 SIMPL domain-containing protein [Sphingomonas yunnanensis]
MNRALVSAALALVALPGSAMAQAPLPMATVVPEGTILDVTAVGKVSRVPDLATVRAGVVTQDAVAATAMQQNADRMAAVVAALTKAGIAPRDIATSRVALSPQYRYAENQPPAVTGYQASNAVTVRFRDVAKAGPVLDALVRAGANQIDGPTLSLADAAGALDEARADAVARARARAALYAKAAGLTVARIVSIGEAGESDGEPPRPFAQMRMAAAPAAADSAVLPGESELSATLNVRFLLK